MFLLRFIFAAVILHGSVLTTDIYAYAKGDQTLASIKCQALCRVATE
jgi:hypothetical protein